jgi:hypothetical protein
MATFMPSSTDEFLTEKSSKPYYETEKIEAKNKENSFPKFKEGNLILPKIIKPVEKPTKLAQNQASGKINANISSEKISQLKVKIESQEYFKKKRNRNPIFNDGVKIGIVFLLIAITLAILSLNQLSLLFGVVSAIFFVLGLKKYMRKNRFRNIFK